MGSNSKYLCLKQQSRKISRKNIKNILHSSKPKKFFLKKGENMQLYQTLAVFLPAYFAQVDPCENWAGPGDCPLRRFNQMNKMFFSQVNSAHSDKELDKMIQGYGCHC